MFSLLLISYSSAPNFSLTQGQHTCKDLSLVSFLYLGLFNIKENRMGHLSRFILLLTLIIKSQFLENGESSIQFYIVYYI